MRKRRFARQARLERGAYRYDLAYTLQPFKQRAEVKEKKK